MPSSDNEEILDSIFDGNSSLLWHQFKTACVERLGMTGDRKTRLNELMANEYVIEVLKNPHYKNVSKTKVGFTLEYFRVSLDDEPEDGEQTFLDFLEYAAKEKCNTNKELRERYDSQQ